MKICDLYNNLDKYFGEETEMNILNILINRGNIDSLEETFSFNHLHISYILIESMQYELQNDILKDLNLEVIKLIRQKKINKLLNI